MELAAFALAVTIFYLFCGRRVGALARGVGAVVEVGGSLMHETANLTVR